MIIYGFITFEWDDEKAKSNLGKHGVSFDEASTVFYDPHALVVDDDERSYNENRFVIVGLSATARVNSVSLLSGNQRNHTNHFSKACNEERGKRLLEAKK